MDNILGSGILLRNKETFESDFLLKQNNKRQRHNVTLKYEEYLIEMKFQLKIACKEDYFSLRSLEIFLFSYLFHFH